MTEKARKAIQMLISQKMWQDMDPHSECAANYFRTYISHRVTQHHGLCVIYTVTEHGFNQPHCEWNGSTEAFCVQNWYTFCVHLHLLKIKHVSFT
jgi:hypothetical protein